MELLAGLSPFIGRISFRIPKPMTMYCRRLVVCTSILALAIGVVSCDTADQQREFVDDAQADPAGFTRTDQNGGVTTADDDDWRVAPLFVARIVVDPAYPNPVDAGLVTIPFRVLQFNEAAGGVFVRAFGPSSVLVTLGESLETNSPGLYTITINPSQIGSTGLHRLFVQDLFGELISYGDLMIQ